MLRENLTLAHVGNKAAAAFMEADQYATSTEQAQTLRRLRALTSREHAVMRLVAAGKLNKVIADELCIAVRTVEAHRSRVFEKLQLRSAAELATLLAGLPESPTPSDT